MNPIKHQLHLYEQHSK